MPKRKNSPGGTNLWDMLRDVLIASMAKGQLPLAIFGLVCVIIVLRMPSADVSRLAFNVLDKLEARYYLGYGLWLLTIGAWFYHTRWQRKTITGEVNRIGEEKTKLQEKLAGKGLESSKS